MSVAFSPQCQMAHMTRNDNAPRIAGELGFLTQASVAIDGSKFKAVNNGDRNFTRAKIERRLAQIDESVARYLSQLDTADLQEPSSRISSICRQRISTAARRVRS
jgi:hypothetical protein